MHFQSVGKSFQKKSVIAIIVATCLIALFTLIATSVSHGHTLSFDTSTLLRLNGKSNELLDAASLAVTHTGDVVTVLAMTSILILLLVKLQRRNALPQVAITISGAIILNALLKLLFQRERPQLWELLTHEATFSFPSGHALITSAFTVLVISLFWYTKWRALAITVGASYVVLVGCSRLYLGVHYPSDVLAGWCVGVAWAAIVYALAYEYRYRSKAHSTH